MRLKLLHCGALRCTFTAALLLMSFMICPAHSMAQDEAAEQQTEEVTNGMTKEDSILMHLKVISEIQTESKHMRDSIRKARREEKRGEVERQQMADEYDAMVKIADNTEQNNLTDGWNVYGWVTFALAIIAFIVSWWSYLYTKKTYYAQMKTEQHTTNAPIDVQLGILMDLPRHFYRNLVCTCAMILKFKFGKKKGMVYPSESNLKKLQTLPDDVLLNIDVDTDKEDNAYKHMHELKLLLRNYNIEVEVASEHLSRRGIIEEALNQDLGNLLFKPLFLTTETFPFKKSLQKELKEGHEPDFVLDAITRMIREHFKKLSTPANFRLLFEDETIGYLSMVMKQGQVDFKDIDKGEDIRRSIDFLLGYVKTEERQKVASISSDGFTNDLPGIQSINDAEAFIQFCKDKQFISDNEDEKKARNSFRHLAPYLNYLRQPTWDTHTILHFILAIDAAIETNRIGMVNYA